MTSAAGWGSWDFHQLRQGILLLYALTLVACGGGGGGGVSATLSLSATAMTPSEIEVSWSADGSAGVIGYDLYRNGAAVWGTHISGTSITDRGLTAGTRYCYKVYAVAFPFGAVSTSNEACTTTSGYATGGWTTSDVAVGYAPDFRIATSGVQHVALRKSDGLHHAWSTGGAWGDELVVAGVGTSGKIEMSIDSLGAIHLVYGNTNLGGVFHASNASGSWAINTLNATGGDLTALAIDSHGKLHVLYTDYNSSLSIYEVWYLTNASGAWVKTYIMGYGSPIQSLAIVADASDNLHVAYAIAGAPYCGLEHWYQSGGGWTMDYVDSGMACQVTLALDGAGVPHLAYRKSMQIIHAHLNGSTWDKETVDTLSWLGSDTVAMALDAGGHLHMSYGDQNSDLKYATNQSGSWTYAYLGQVVSADILRVGDDGHAYILFGPDSSGTLRLARSP